MWSDTRRLMAINNAHGGGIRQPALSSGTIGLSLLEAPPPSPQTDGFNFPSDEEEK